MTRIEQEKRIVRKMIELYCRHHLHQDTMPDEYLHLADFACRRLDHCTYGEQKTACKDCPTHCYAPKEREAIREVMRWAGPRMIWYAPKDAFIHFFSYGETLAPVALFQNWCYCSFVLHTLLYPFLRPDAATNKCCSKGNLMDYTIRIG